MFVRSSREGCRMVVSVGGGVVSRSLASSRGVRLGRGVCGMLRECNTAWRALATLAVGVALLSPAARASNEPDADVTLEAYRAVDEWVRSWSELPLDIEPNDSWYLDSDGVYGARVELRLANRVIGEGSALGVRGGGGKSVRTATANALLEAAERLQLPLDSALGPVMTERVESIQISLELAGDTVALVGDSWDVAALAVSPGLDGVVARVGDSVEALFPSEMLLGHVGVVPSLRGLSLRLELPPEELSSLRSREGLAIERFASSWVSQIEAGAFPTFLARGGRLVGANEVSEATLMEFAKGTVTHLRSRVWVGEAGDGLNREQLGLMGTYLAGRDSFDPLISSPREQALAAYALSRFSTLAGISDDDSHAAAILGWRVLDELLVVAESEEPIEEDLNAQAFWLAAFMLLPSDSLPIDINVNDLSTFARASSVRLFEAVRDTPAAAMNSVERSVLLFGLMEAAELLDNPSGARSLVRLTAGNMLADANAGTVVAMMPWLGMVAHDVSKDDEIRLGGVLFAQMRDTIYQYVMRRSDVGLRDADLEGGVVFTRGGVGLPTWQTLRAATALAVLLGDPGVTRDDVALRELGRIVPLARFAMQLQVSAVEGHLFRAPRRAVGGVRIALWEPTVTLDATAYGLLFAVEVLEAINEM